MPRKLLQKTCQEKSFEYIYKKKIIFLEIKWKKYNMYSQNKMNNECTKLNVKFCKTGRRKYMKTKLKVGEETTIYTYNFGWSKKSFP